MTFLEPVGIFIDRPSPSGPHRGSRPPLVHPPSGVCADVTLWVATPPRGRSRSGAGGPKRSERGGYLLRPCSRQRPSRHVIATDARSGRLCGGRTDRLRCAVQLRWIDLGRGRDRERRASLVGARPQRKEDRIDAFARGGDPSRGIAEPRRGPSPLEPKGSAANVDLRSGSSWPRRSRRSERSSGRGAMSQSIRAR